METRKFIKKSVCTLVCLLLIASLFLMVACDEKEGEGDENLPTIKVQTDVAEGSVLTKGQKVNFMVMISDDSPYTVSVSDETLAKVSGTTMQILKDVSVDTEISLIVSVDRFPNHKKFVTFQLKAPITLPTIYMSANKAENSRLDINDEITITATASDDSDVVLSVSDTTLASINGNVVKIIAQPEHETTLIVTVALKDFPTITASKSYYVMAPVVEGQVTGANGNVLTTQLIQALGNKNITVNAAVTDVYVADDGSEEEVEYKSTVKMDEGKWYGEWYAVVEDGVTPNVIVDSYRKSSTTAKTYETDYSTGISTVVEGHAFEKVYINKDNEVASQIQTDSRSYPYLWENNHLWNHMEEFASDVATKFVYRETEDVFEFYWKSVDSDGNVNIFDAYDEYLMTYLAYSFTPMLSDTFENLYIKMEDGEITQLLVKTAETVSGSSRYYTEVVFTFENIGETEVPEPQVYSADSRNEALATAIEKMKNATSYTFSTEEIATSSPSYDESDYTIDSASTAASFPMGAATGTVGITGKLVKGNAVLIKETGMYTSTMEGDAPYWMSYSGYKDNGDGTYDEFVYNSSTQRLEGTHQYSGTLNDMLPSWDFNVNIFKFNGSQTDANGKTVTKYVLRDSTISGEVAKEVCMHSNVKNTVSSSQYAFEIAVDSDGNVVYTSFPYEYSSYAGYCKTTYSKVNSTAFTDEFDTYVQRVLPEWSDIETSTYYYKHTNDFKKYDCYDEDKDDPYHVGVCDHVATLDTVIYNVFGLTTAQFPTMATFRQIFGDNIYTPYFFEYDVTELADGSKQYTDYVFFTAQAPAEYLDDKGNLSDAKFLELYAKMISAFEGANLGITASASNTDYTGGTIGQSDRWVAFANDNIIISLNNNHTKYFWIEIHKLGDWTLKK